MNELNRWSGHKSHLDRYLKGSFGTAPTPLGAGCGDRGGLAFFCVKARMTVEPREDHAHYLRSWIADLKADNRAIFTLASQAQKAADYLQVLQPS